MGTRGLYGFYKNGITKATYNHWDSYPEGLGLDLLEELREYTIEQLNETFDRIILVSESSKATDEQIEECKRYLDLSVSTRSSNDWYCLLRQAQGSLRPWVKDGLRYMIDNASFIRDSLFCEWAYIINLDTNELEVWKGFQRLPVKSRYYDHRSPVHGYYPCVLVKRYKLDSLPSNEKFLEDMKVVEMIEDL